MQKGVITCTLEWNHEGSGDVSRFPVLKVPVLLPPSHPSHHCWSNISKTHIRSCYSLTRPWNLWELSMSLKLKQQSSSGPCLPLQPIHPPPSTPSNLTCSDIAVARCSKGNKEANLVEKKVCFILDVSIVQRLTLPAYSREARAFIDRGRQLHAKAAVSSDSHLEIGHWWSDQHHSDCFKYS